LFRNRSGCRPGGKVADTSSRALFHCAPRGASTADHHLVRHLPTRDLPGFFRPDFSSFKSRPYDNLNRSAICSAPHHQQDGTSANSWSTRRPRLYFKGPLT